MSGLGSLGDRPYRAKPGPGVILGDPDDEAGDDQPDDRTPEQVPAAERADLFGSAFFGQRRPGVDPGDTAADFGTHAAENLAHDQPDQRDCENSGDDETLVHRAHHIGAVLAQLHEIGADDTGHDAGPADEQRQRHHRQQQIAQRFTEQQRGQNHGGPDRDDIGFEQIGSHARAVADIVTDIVGDDRRVARIVLGDPGFDLADQIGADIGGLGEDPAAKTCENRYQRGAEGQADQPVDHFAAIGRVSAGADEVPEEHRNREQGEACHQHAGDRARTEGQRQALLKPALRGSGGTHVGAHRNVHADEAGDTRQDRPDHEADRRHDAEEGEDQHRYRDADHADRRILAFQIGLCAFLDCAGDFLHSFVAGACAKHLAAGHEAVHDGQQSQQYCYEN